MSLEEDYIEYQKRVLKSNDLPEELRRKFTENLDLDHTILPLLDIESFKADFVEANRGKPLVLIRFAAINGLTLEEFVQKIKTVVKSVLDVNTVEFVFHFMESSGGLLMGISPTNELSDKAFPNIDNAIGRFHARSLQKKTCFFDFGVARTQCNYISNQSEIYDELIEASEKNLRDNLVRWSWTYFNRAYTYISGKDNVVIQPTVFLDPRTQTLSVKGGEVFVGGGLYPTYRDLVNDIRSKHEKEMNRVELLILEKLLSSCVGAPGLLKFNISPQSLIDTFTTTEKVHRFRDMLTTKGLDPANIRIELVEKPYEEKERGLKEVCEDFYRCGITFAADDFGVRSQSHQVALSLGAMIKEFKLDPISFKFKADNDHLKFLDNLAFIEYCKRLADNRGATITAEAVDDYDTLRFLMEHHIFQFQAFMFCGKISIEDYRQKFSSMQNLPIAAAKEIFTNEEYFDMQREDKNIFELASRLKLV